MEDFIYLITIGIVCILLSILMIFLVNNRIKYFRKVEKTGIGRKRKKVIGYLLSVIMFIGGVAIIINSFSFL